MTELQCQDCAAGQIKALDEGFLGHCLSPEYYADEEQHIPNGDEAEEQGLVRPYAFALGKRW